MKNEQLEVRLRTMLRERAHDISSVDARRDLDRVLEVAPESDGADFTGLTLQPVTGRRSGPTRWLAPLTVAAAVLVVVSLAVVLRHQAHTPAGSGPVHGSALKSASAGNAECVDGSGTTVSWTALRAGGVAFGVNDVTLASRDTKVVVTSVVPQGVKGSVTVQHAAFIPIAGVGSVYPWSDVAKYSVTPWALHREVPTTLSYEPRYTSVPNVPPGYDGKTFQLIVGITSGPYGGQADHMRVFYTENNRAYYVDVYTSVAMYPTAAGCQAVVPIPGVS